MQVLEEDACLATVEIKVVALFIPLVMYKRNNAGMCNLSNFGKK